MIASIKRQEETDHGLLGTETDKLAFERKRIVSKAKKHAETQSSVDRRPNLYERRYEFESNARRGRMKLH